jgi:hypothetical protein
MANMFIPDLSVEQYCAVGEFAYQFGNLERWVNWCYMEAYDQNDPKKVPWNFQNRVDELQNRLSSQLTPGVLNFEQVKKLATCRNDLLHGEPWSLIRISNADSEGTVEFEPKHINFNARFLGDIEVEPEKLKALSNEARDLAERLSGVAVDLSIAKHNHGLKPIFNYLGN